MSVAILLVLPIFLSGYIFAHTTLFYKYKLMRIDGYHLYFSSASWGVICVLFATTIYIIFNHYFPSCIVDLIKAGRSEFNHAMGTSNNSYFTLAVIGLMSIAGAWLTGLAINSRVTANTSHRNAIKGDDLELLFYEASDKKLPASFSMLNGKVYIGRIINTYNPEEERKFFRILPNKSGCRDETTKLVTFNTDYDQIIEKTVIKIFEKYVESEVWAFIGPVKNINISLYERIMIRKEIVLTLRDFQLILPVSDLTAAHIYKDEIRLSFEQQQKKERKRLKNFKKLKQPVNKD